MQNYTTVQNYTKISLHANNPTQNYLVSENFIDTPKSWVTVG